MELRDVKSPEDIRNLSVRELESLAQEIRWVIIGTVAKTGGHLAASLGAVELTLALHSVFDTPRDKIVWDVGHQTYALARSQGGTKGSIPCASRRVVRFPRGRSPYDVYDTDTRQVRFPMPWGLQRGI